MWNAQALGMRAKKLEDLQVYTKALEGIAAVSPILQRLTVRKDFDLHDQLAESSGNIPGHIAEGFGQLSDKHFAHYLGIARGSAQETRGHLATALQKEHISADLVIAPDSTLDFGLWTLDSGLSTDPIFHHLRRHVRPV